MVEFLGYALLAVVSYLLNGWALSVMWAWFIVPVFNVRNINIIESLGIALVMSFLTMQYNGEDKRDSATKLIYAVLTPLLFLGIGWVYHLFM